MKKILIKNILEKIEEFDKIAIFRHVFPDPDSYGSQNGLKSIIESTYPDKKVYLLGEHLEKLGYINVELIRDERQTILERRIYTRESMLGGIDKIVHRGIDNSVDRGIDKNVRYNNIYYNNITHTQADEISKKKYADKVYMFEDEYNNLIQKYGQTKTDKCITELDLYKKSKGVEYASDYDTIQRWVIDRVNEIETRNNSPNKNNINKRKPSFEQREYPEGFFDDFYANL